MALQSRKAGSERESLAVQMADTPGKEMKEIRWAGGHGLHDGRPRQLYKHLQMASGYFILRRAGVDITLTSRL